MTITLTIEEIKKYQDTLNDWYKRRCVLIEQWLAQGEIRYDLASFHQKTPSTEALNNKLTEWEKTNPIPTLLPKV